MAALARMLPDGKRLHLNHGPIDLIIEVDGLPQEVKRSYQAAEHRFASVLEELVSELALLRSEIGPQSPRPKGNIAFQMDRATRPHWRSRVTPMAAVAGAVADELLAVMIAKAEFSRAYVNNGGDIALYLTNGASFNIASAGGEIDIHSDDTVRGIATSGWRGRSFSLGIADSVTVLASSGAKADVAATLIANAVDVQGSTKVLRQPAYTIAPDSDLRSRLVTVDVLPLDQDEIDIALNNGVEVALDLMQAGHIAGASLILNGAMRCVGVPAPSRHVATVSKERLYA